MAVGANKSDAPSTRRTDRILTNTSNMSIHDEANPMPLLSRNLKKNLSNRDGSAKMVRLVVKKFRKQPDLFTLKKRKTVETQATPRARGASADSATKTQSATEDKKSEVPPESHRLLMSRLEEKEKVKLIRAEEERDREKLTEFLLKPTKYFLNPNEQTYNQMTELLNSDQLGVGSPADPETTEAPQNKRHDPQEVQGPSAQKQNQPVKAALAHQAELDRPGLRRLGLQALGPNRLQP